MAQEGETSRHRSRPKYRQKTTRRSKVLRQVEQRKNSIFQDKNYWALRQEFNKASLLLTPSLTPQIDDKQDGSINPVQAASLLKKLVPKRTDDEVAYILKTSGDGNTDRFTFWQFFLNCALVFEPVGAF
mmetsp:Transcript_30170/g.33712  ORF Transcript_30170/g.33712 Transcript_30170/m.33712 type:complete len:129 (-) Transcript_30170:2645-3031(-)